MTLNITVATPRVLLAATDRRLTNPRTRAIRTERSTKLTVLEHPSGVALITYNGIGSFRDKTPADWLLELASRVQLASLPLSDALEAIRSDAEQRIASLPRGTDRRHSFVVGAWEDGRASIYVVSNYEDAVGDGAESQARARFTVSVSKPAPGRDVLVLATGSTDHLVDSAFLKIGAVAKRRGAAGIDVKNLVAKAIASASEVGRRRSRIGASVLWAVAEIGRPVEAGLDVPDGTTVQEMPNLIQQGLLFRQPMIAVGTAASAMWNHTYGPDETVCSNCGAPLPVGYSACGVCRHPRVPDS